MTPRARATAISSFSTKDLAQWLTDDLQGSSLVTAFYRPDAQSPHAAVIEVYRALDRSLRTDIDLIVLDLLDKVRIIDPRWPLDAVRELLLTIDPILVDSSHRADAVEHILALTEQESDAIGERETAHVECLQALQALGHKGGITFWRDAYERGGSHYAELVACGLAEIDPGAAFDFLADLPWSDYVETALFGILPLLIDEHGVTKVATLAVARQASWPADTRELLLEVFASEGLSVEASVAVLPSRRSSDVIDEILRSAVSDADALVTSLYVASDARYTRDEVERAVQTLVVKWDPMDSHQGRYSENMLQVIRRFRSTEALLAVTAFLENLFELRTSNPQDKFIRLATDCMSTIHTFSTYVRQLLTGESSGSAIAVQQKLIRCLQRSLSEPSIGKTAFEIIVSHAAEADLPPTIVAALQSVWFSTADCDEALLRFYEKERVHEFMDRAFEVAHGSTHLAAAAKLYQYIVAMREFNAFVDESVALVSAQDRQTPKEELAFVREIVESPKLYDC